jgi:hypothetical protein
MLKDGEVLGWAVIIWVVGAWLTHVSVCIKSASWIFLFIGSFIFPISVVHGTGVWFGIF